MAKLAEIFDAHDLKLEIGKPARSIKPGDLVNTPFGMIRVVDPRDVADVGLALPEPQKGITP